MSKIERIAGIPGKLEVEMRYGGDWYVTQYAEEPGTEQIYGPVRKTKQGAIRAWNSMVRRIRKANAGASK